MGLALSFVRLAAALLCLSLLAACASAPTRITLMPDQDGRVGGVVVANAQGSQAVSRAWEAVEVGDAASAPALRRARDPDEVGRTHRALLAAQPTPPRSFVLHFLFDSMELTPESRQLLPQVLDVVRGRLPTEVTVFGYADSAGAAAYNLELSAQRARAVAALLRQIDPDLPVEVQYFGDREPLVKTPPGVPEPRNRRAEIFIL